MKEKIQLWQGDCLDKMKDIPDGSVDLVLTDPPYGTTACKWDTIIPFEPMWEQLKRITKKNGAIVLFGSQPFASALVMSNPEMFKYEWVWEKEQAVNVMQIKKRAGKTVENICVFYEKQPTYNPQMRKHVGKLVTNKVKSGFGKLVDSSQKKPIEYKDTGYRYPTQVLKIQSERLKGQIHPTQKPVALMEYLIKTYTNEGETVLDFTMGSGTTGVACKNLNRNFIGIELDPEYFKIAEQRINSAQESLLTPLSN